MNITFEKSISMAVFLLLATSPAWAGSEEPWNQGASGVLGWLQGDLATTIATIAIICVGCLGFFGRLEWRVALPIIAGFVLVFGAPGIVSAFKALFS